MTTTTTPPGCALQEHVRTRRRGAQSVPPRRLNLPLLELPRRRRGGGGGAVEGEGASSWIRSFREEGRCCITRYRTKTTMSSSYSGSSEGGNLLPDWDNGLRTPHPRRLDDGGGTRARCQDCIDSRVEEALVHERPRDPTGRDDDMAGAVRSGSSDGKAMRDTTYVVLASLPTPHPRVVARKRGEKFSTIALMLQPPSRLRRSTGGHGTA